MKEQESNDLIRYCHSFSFFFFFISSSCHHLRDLRIRVDYSFSLSGVRAFFFFIILLLLYTWMAAWIEDRGVLLQEKKKELYVLSLCQQQHNNNVCVLILRENCFFSPSLGFLFNIRLFQIFSSANGSRDRSTYFSNQTNSSINYSLLISHYHGRSNTTSR